MIYPVDNIIHRINLYPVDLAIGFSNTYLLDIDLSGRYIIHRINLYPLDNTIGSLILLQWIVIFSGGKRYSASWKTGARKYWNRVVFYLFIFIFLQEHWSTNLVRHRRQTLWNSASVEIMSKSNEGEYSTKKTKVANGFTTNEN